MFLLILMYYIVVTQAIHYVDDTGDSNVSYSNTNTTSVWSKAVLSDSRSGEWDASL